MKKRSAAARSVRRALASARLFRNLFFPETRPALFRPKVAPVRPPSAKRRSRALAAQNIRPKPGDFVERSFWGDAGTRTYKLYVPKTYGRRRMPLVVMLHGCTQNPNDFAAGTQMNALADARGFLVVYPAQSARASPGRCWNWFRPHNQKRDLGEPSLIAGITREVASAYLVDQKRIFIAGLSAGAAMAVIMANTYPDLFAAVGAHSGFAYRKAYSLSSALAAMRGNRGVVADGVDLMGAAPTRPASTVGALPTIVFHGDRDKTIHVDNGSEIVAQAIANGMHFGIIDPRRTFTQERISTNGREHTNTVYYGARARPIVEYWLLHGGGHAWSGGGTKGSFTEVTGPNASAEMIRFFLSMRPESNGRNGPKVGYRGQRR
jgi:poly(hydroxyalkanoate) depolymerase family esterase